MRPGTAVDPSTFFRRRGEAGSGLGSILLESREHSVSDGRFSLLVTQPRARLTVRGESVRFRVSDPAALPLSNHLAGLLGDPVFSGLELSGRLPRGGASPSNEADRLLEPCALDLVRFLLRLTRDEEQSVVPVAAYGSFGFELAEHFDELPALSDRSGEEADLDLLLGFDAVRYDHRTGAVEAIARAIEGPGFDAEQERAAAERRLGEVVGDLSGASREPEVSESEDALDLELQPVSPESDFLRGVETILEHVRSGDVFQCVLSRRFVLESNAAPLDVYDILSRRDPSPYHFFFDRDGTQLFGASPEPFLEAKNGRVEVRPIAGTVARGRDENGVLDAELDERLALRLAFDPKEQAEHAMLVDLARNDLARVCLPGTRRAELPPVVVRFRGVQHLVSKVSGTLRPQYDALHAYRACANAGTVSGAPKLRATELLRSIEGRRRGAYGGAVGFFDQDGRMATAIAIRTLRHRAGTYVAQAGAGIVADSDPERELEETELKARSALHAVRSAERVGGAA